MNVSLEIEPVGKNTQTKSVAGHLESASIEDESKTGSVEEYKNYVTSTSSKISTEALLVSTPHLVSL